MLLKIRTLGRKESSAENGKSAQIIGRDSDHNAAQINNHNETGDTVDVLSDLCQQHGTSSSIIIMGDLNVTLPNTTQHPP